MDGGGDEFVELIVVNAPVVCSVGGTEDCVSNVRAHFVGDGLCCPFFCANNRLIEEIDAVGFFLGVRLCSDGGKK